MEKNPFEQPVAVKASRTQTERQSAMVESIQSSHQVNSFPLKQFLASFLTTDFAIPLLLVVGPQNSEALPSQLLFVIQGILPAIPLVKTVKPTLNQRHSTAKCPKIPASAVSQCSTWNAILDLGTALGDRSLMGNVSSFLSPLQWSLGSSPAWYLGSSNSPGYGPLSPQ